MNDRPFVHNFNDGTELELIRSHELKRVIRRFADEVSEANPDMVSRYVDDEAVQNLSKKELFIIELDILFSNLLENCKVRNYITYKMSGVLDNDRVTVQALKHEYRSYIAECVILYERLAYLLAYLEYCYELSNINFDDDILALHKFFSPSVIDIRNFNAHQRYYSKQSFNEVDELERKIHDIEYIGESDPSLRRQYLRNLSDLINKEIEWIEYTESEFASFFAIFFDRLVEKIISNSNLLIPERFPNKFKLNLKVTPQYRRKLNHKMLFGDGLGAP